MKSATQKETLLDDKWPIVSYSLAWVVVAVAGGGDSGMEESAVKVLGEFGSIYNTSPQKGTSQGNIHAIRAMLPFQTRF